MTKEKKEKSLLQKIRNPAIICIVTAIIAISIFMAVEADQQSKTKKVSEYITSIEYDDNGNLVSIDSDEKLGRLIWEAREMEQHERFQMMLEYNIDDIDNKLQKDEALALIYVDFPKDFVEEYGHDRFMEFQIVEINYRIGLGHTIEDLYELAELQQQQLEGDE